MTPTLARLGAVSGNAVWKSSKTRFFAVAACVAVTFGFAYYAYRHPMDYRVYYYGTRGVFEGTRPVYGLNSGLGWPMHYRYPPLFLLLFAPFALLPLGWGAAIWVVLKIVVLAALLKRCSYSPAKATRCRLRLRRSGRRRPLLDFAVRVHHAVSGRGIALREMHNFLFLRYQLPLSCWRKNGQCFLPRVWLWRSA